MRRLICALLLAVGLYAVETQSGAGQAARYRVPDRLWPKGSRILAALVPTNSDALVNAFHRQTKTMAQLGRIAGPGFEEHVRWSKTTKARCSKKPCTKKVKHTVDYSYVVSVFPNDDLAYAALLDGQKHWGPSAGLDVSDTLPQSLGGNEYAYRVGDPRSRSGVIAFNESCVLVEMTDRTAKTDGSYRDAGMLVLVRIGHWLDGRVQCAKQATTSTPTFTTTAAPTSTPTPTPTVTPAPVSTNTPTATSTATSAPSAGTQNVQVSASVSDPSPHQNEVETVFGRILVNGRGVAGVPMDTSWHYKTTTSGCSGTTDGSGTASCSRSISRATIGYTVSIGVTFTYSGQVYTTGTSFTPQ